MMLSKNSRIKLSLGLLIVLTLLIFSVAAQSPPPSTDQTAPKNNEKPVYRIANMHTHPWFWEVLVSSAVGWVLGLVKGFSGAKDWLATYIASNSKFLVLVLDMLIFIGVGSYFGTAIYEPTSFLAAMCAGLTWPIGLGSLATRQSSNGAPSTSLSTNTQPGAPATGTG
jgi:hypothetical protein